MNNLSEHFGLLSNSIRYIDSLSQKNQKTLREEKNLLELTWYANFMCGDHANAEIAYKKLNELEKTTKI